APIHIRKVLSVGHQTAGLCPSLRLKHSGEPPLYREVDDVLALLKHNSILQNQERVGALLGDRGKGRRKVLWALHRMRLQGYSQLPSRSFRLFPSEWERGVGRIPQNCSPRQTGHHFLSASRRFALASAVSCAPPVRLPPGCARLSTRPVLRGS